MTLMRKLLPTAAPKPIPPEFLDVFIRHGWQRVERMFGKSTVLGWSKAIGRKRMAEMRRRYLHEQAERIHGAAKAANLRSGMLHRGFRASVQTPKRKEMQ